MQNLQTVYPKQVMSDISTSYCFICLLHLANEKGLVIEKEDGLTELTIAKDHTAEITVGGDWSKETMNVPVSLFSVFGVNLEWMRYNEDLYSEKQYRSMVPTQSACFNCDALDTLIAA